MHSDKVKIINCICFLISIFALLRIEYGLMKKQQSHIIALQVLIVIQKQTNEQINI